MNQVLFRFKTELEFIEEFGLNWRRHTNWSTFMDDLIGTELEPKYTIEALDLWLNGNSFKLYKHSARDNIVLPWTINKKMLKYNEEIISVEN